MRSELASMQRGQPMNCDQCRSNASAYLDDELEESFREEVRKHLVECPDCETEYLELTALHNRLQTLRIPFDPQMQARKVIDRSGIEEAAPRVVNKPTLFFPTLLAATVSIALAASCAAFLLRFDFSPDEEQPIPASLRLPSLFVQQGRLRFNAKTLPTGIPLLWKASSLPVATASELQYRSYAKSLRTIE